jgi:hypothetical protein
MAISPKQIAARALAANMTAFLDAARKDLFNHSEGRGGSKLIKAQRAEEFVVKISLPFVQKIEKLTKRKIGKSVAQSIEEQDEKDGADF